jgi:Domain of unknown function (DUF4173)
VDEPLSESPTPAPGEQVPQLLVAPGGGDLPTIAWPGPEGVPAWAIPVSVPPGTRGYAIFLPLIPHQAAPAESAIPAAPAAARSAPPGTGASSQPAAAPTGSQAPAEPPTVDADGGTANADGDSAVPAGTTQPAAETVRAPQPAAETVRAQQPAAASGAAPHPASIAQAAPWPGLPPQPQRLVPAAAHGQPPVVPGQPVPTPQPWPVAPYPGMLRQSPPAPGFLARHWPGPAARKGWDVPLAVLAGGVGTAVFLPLGRVGIGWVLAALAIVASVVAVVWRGLSEEPRSERMMRTVWAVSALALLSVLAFRNAWWLVTFSVLGALGCAALAVFGGSRLRSILFSVVPAPFAALRGTAWVSRHLAGRSRKQADTGTRILLSVFVTALVLLVFGALLSSADAAFSALLHDLVPPLRPVTVFTTIFLLAVGALITTLALYTLAAPPDLSTVDAPPARRFGALEWAVPVGALVVLFAGFVGVQFTVLFGGRRHVLENAKLTYAEYARSGFWQLFTVTLLTLVVLAAAGRWARRETARERLLLRGLLGALCVLSIVIVISALHRMYTYQQVYSFTGERVFVMGFEIMLGVVFLLVLAAGIRLQGAWLPRATVGLAVVLLLTLAVMNPEEYVAKRNIARYQQEGKIDAWYLRALSADATPALADLPDPVRRCVLSWISDDLDGQDPWYAWNLDRQRARDALDQLGPQAIGNPSDCQRADQFDFPKTR